MNKLKIPKQLVYLNYIIEHNTRMKKEMKDLKRKNARLSQMYSELIDENARINQNIQIEKDKSSKDVLRLNASVCLKNWLVSHSKASDCVCGDCDHTRRVLAGLR